MKQPTLDEQIQRARRQQVRVEGSRAAAWLIYTKRAAFRRHGAVDYRFRVVDGKLEKEPRYFLVAMALLKMRPRKWRVEVRDDEDGSKVYRVTWLRWHTSGDKWRTESIAQRADAARRARNARKRAQARWFR